MSQVIIIGAGYVGLAYSYLFNKLGKSINVVEVDKQKLNNLQNGISPLSETKIKELIESQPESISYSDSPKISEDTELIIVSVPTSSIGNELDTSILTNVLDSLSTVDVPVIIKSTVPVGFTKKYIERSSNQNIVFSPEFLREGNAVEDILHPSRIILGTDNNDLYNKVREYFNHIHSPIIQMSPSEAEAVKLLSNTYLAMRVAFFNEVDTFAHFNGLDTDDVISGMSFDPRIGDVYNNPSFGYGGYCLPKDVKQTAALTSQYFSPLITNIDESNKRRKEYTVLQVIKSQAKSVGVYTFEMKHNSDNHRESALLDICNDLKNYGITVNYLKSKAPTNINPAFNGYDTVEELADNSEFILTNRIHKELLPYKHKLISRDVSSVD